MKTDPNPPACDDRTLIRYARNFCSGDPATDRNLRLKLAHTFRVRKYIDTLAAHEGFDPNSTLLASRAALLHDLSRFEQFRRFGTFNDAESYDHGDRSAQLALQLGFVDDLAPAARQDVLDAVRVHNKISLPADLGPQALRLGQALRDADKLDIFPVLFDYLANPENQAVVFGLSPQMELSEKVREFLHRDACPPYSALRTVGDFLGSKLIWAKDLNFDWTRREFVRLGYLERLAAALPDTAEFRALHARARHYLVTAAPEPNQ